MKKNSLVIATLLSICVGFLLLYKKSIVKKDSIDKKYKPTALKDDISVTLFKKLNHLPVRIVYDAISNTFYTCNIDGWIFRIPVIDGIPQEEIPFLAPEEHHINFLQGLAFDKNTFFLVGNNNNEAASNGFGIVEKCEILPDGSHIWTTMLKT